MKTDTHVRFMKAAIRQAELAAQQDEVPVGAVIVHNGRIIARGHNQRESRQDVTMHAEIAAIRQASRKMKSWRLENCILYVTLEPCLMCAGAILQARIPQIVYGAVDPKAGACVSVARVFELPLHHTVEMTGEVLAAECSQQLKDFFNERRRKDRSVGSRAVRRRQAKLEHKQRQN